MRFVKNGVFLYVRFRCGWIQNILFASQIYQCFLEHKILPSFLIVTIQRLIDMYAAIVNVVVTFFWYCKKIILTSLCEYHKCPYILKKHTHIQHTNVLFAWCFIMEAVQFEANAYTKTTFERVAKTKLKRHQRDTTATLGRHWHDNKPNLQRRWNVNETTL